MAPLRIATTLVALAVTASLIAGCNVFGGPSAQPSICTGVPADIGGCDNPPTYSVTDCDELARHWGEVVNDRTLKVIAEPAVVGNEQRSARIHSVLALAAVTLGMHLDGPGRLGACSGQENLSGAEPSFTDALRAGVVTALYDDNPPAAWDQFLGEAQRVLVVLDVPVASSAS